MQQTLLLVFAVLLTACSYTGDALQSAGAGGTGPVADPPPKEEPDPRFQEPMRPGIGRVVK